jgi:photosystem II stability/assembly factor-like uncharacterized protein
MTLVGTVWAPRGPTPMNEQGRQDNGLTSAIAINPNDSNVIYQGTAGGGVWRSNDGGSTWTPISDRQISMGIGEPGAVAIDPNNTDTIYVGTSGRVAQQIQAGLFKSTDGGASWIRLGSRYPAGNTGNANQFFNHWINVIIVDPANSQTIYLSSAPAPGSGVLGRVFRSLDGGQNWTFGTNSGGDVRSLVLDTSSPVGARILYAGITGRGVFQSTDGGQNWTQILSGATPAVANALCPSPPCIPARSAGKFIVALAPPTSPPNPAGVQVLYATMEGQPAILPPGSTPAPDPVGLFVSTNQGATWTQQSATGMPTGTQRGYSFHMAVDPASPGDGANDIIYFGDVNQARSTDSGANLVPALQPRLACTPIRTRGCSSLSQPPLPRSSTPGTMAGFSDPPMAGQLGHHVTPEVYRLGCSTTSTLSRTPPRVLQSAPCRTMRWRRPAAAPG